MPDLVVCAYNPRKDEMGGWDKWIPESLLPI